METSIAVFKAKEIREMIHNNEWWFAISDVVEALTNSTDPRQYVKKMRKRESELNSCWGTICTPLRLKALDGKMRKTNEAQRHSKTFRRMGLLNALAVAEMQNGTKPKIR